MEQNWTVATRRVVDAAITEAIRRKCAFVEPVHFLNAIVLESDCGAARWLREEFSLDKAALTPEFAPLLTGVPAKERPGKYSADTREVLNSMSRHTSGRDKTAMTTLDLLEAILRQEQDAAVKKLTALGVKLQSIERAQERDRFRDP
jgi:ATP-dependent Clp protease ATP-binding subunit ClpA